MLLALSLVFGLSASAFAAEGEAKINFEGFTDMEEVYIDEQGQFVLTKTQNEGVITVTYKSLIDEEQYTVVNNRGNLYLDGVLIGKGLSNAYVDNSVLNEKKSLFATSSIKWGKWQNFSERINTGGKKAGAISAALAAAAPWVPIRLISGFALLVQSSYSYVTIAGKIRYGTEGDYLHYERYTNFYGNGKDPLLKNDFHEHRKTAQK